VAHRAGQRRESYGDIIIMVNDENIKVEFIQNGLVIKSSNGTDWRINTEDDGTLRTTAQ
jgi:hypothetical protein